MATASVHTGNRVRNPRFDFTDVARRWLLGSRIASNVANGANLLFDLRPVVARAMHTVRALQDPQPANAV